jgi:SPP1 gp7 family putative phage head morphogenesis protein
MPDKPEKPLSPRAKRLLARKRFLRARKAEKQYQRQLAAVGNQVGKLIEGLAPGGKVIDSRVLSKALRDYSEILKPWARAVTNRMHADVERRDASSWMQLSREMGAELQREIKNAPTGQLFRSLMAEQVSLITSIPREAANRVQRLTREAISSTAGRAGEIAKEIMRSGSVAAGRARLIARTETSRTAGLLMEARSRYVGSTHYIWHTSGDSDVREEHKRLNGKTFAWAHPPNAGTSTNPMYYHPGCGPNCRCYAEPILPDTV